MSDHDDGTVGHILSRREIVALVGAAGFAWITGSPLAAQGRPAGAAGCVVRPEQTEGPYFVDEMLKVRGQGFEGKTCVVSGSGNVAVYTIEKIHQLGGRVVACSDSGQ